MAQLLATSTRSAAAAASMHERTVKVVPRVALSPFAHTVVRSTVSQARRDVARRSVIAQAKIDKVNGEELEVAIATRETPLIIDFFATWCGPCLLLARELEQVAERMDGKVRVVKVDVDENPDLSAMLKIQGLPTIVFIPKENGKPALRTEGLLPAAQILEILDQMEAGQVPGQGQGQPGQEQPAPQ